MSEKNNSKSVKDVQIIRKGNEIIIPENMTIEAARFWLRKKEEAEEKVISIHHEIDCFPLDGVLALCKALYATFGFTELRGTNGFFSENPPTIVEVEDSNGKMHSAPIGRMAPPPWEGGYIETFVPDKPCLIITGQIKKKFEKSLQEVIQNTKKILAEDSIYKGKAIRIDLAWMEEGNFHPMRHAPKFINVKDIHEEDLILNKVTQFEIENNIWTLIEQTDACVANGIPLKQGILLYGKYGTGKTLTAKATAKKAEENGWTFIYLKNVRHIANALRLAELYSPAVVFAEDVDQITQEQRTESLNEILNTLDGVDTKSKSIITVLTSNHHERINPAMMRAGRIDSVIEMTAPDEEAAERFVKHFAKLPSGENLLAPGINLAEVGVALAGFVPAFIAEAVHKAKRAAIGRCGSDIVGKVTEEDLLNAAASLKKHIEMSDIKKQKENMDRLDTVLEEVVVNALNKHKQS